MDIALQHEASLVSWLMAIQYVFIDIGMVP